MAILSPSPLAPTRSPRTAYVVLDPHKVPATMRVLVDGEYYGGVLTDLHTFVRRDLKRALTPYFADVQVVSPGQTLGPRPHVIVDVRIDRVEIGITSRVETDSYVNRSGSASLTWAIAVRTSESSEYLYSFAGQSTGRVGVQPAIVLRTMFERAIADFLDGYRDKGIHPL